MGFNFRADGGVMSTFRKLSLAAVLLASARLATAASVPSMGFATSLAPWFDAGAALLFGSGLLGAGTPCRREMAAKQIEMIAA